MANSSYNNYIIGIDFDNTIITYDDLLYKLALEKGLISPKTTKSKKEIRDAIRKHTDGDLEWQKLQAIIYGSAIKDAKLVDGVKDFFKLCKKNKATVYIISHKTKYSNLYKSGNNFRMAALNWMKNNNFFEPGGLGLSEKNIFFESTQEEKIKRIVDLKCTHFIDDLQEFFNNKEFPRGVKKILYDPRMNHPNMENIAVFKNWEAINGHLFSNKN